MTSEITLTKTAKWADVEVSGNVPTNDVTRMTIDAAGGAHIMSMLTDIYSDQELAVLREYTSNGIDAHRAAGQTAPIEVHLPSALSPNFIVQDYGTGMSLEDIKYIYSSYGASTKRNDMDQIGAFGLGCKSALTLTQQFTLVSIKDKKRTVAHILRGEDGVGEVSIISHTDTQAPNGVKVTIPVPDHKTFVSKANSFFYTWNSDDVLVNGEKPKTLFDLDHITFKPSNGTSTAAHLIRPAKKRGWYDQFEKGLYFMLSGIRYEVDLGNSAVRGRVENDLRDFLAQTALIVEIPIGSIDLVPSREALRYSPRTLSNIELFVKGILNDMYTLIVADVVDAPTRRDALIRSKFWSDLTRGTGRLTFKWGTEDIPRTIVLHDLTYQYFERSARADSGYMLRRTDYRGDDVDAARHINVQNLAASENVYYTVDPRDPTEIRGYSTMFRDYLLSQGITLNSAALFHLRKAPTSEWFKSLTTEVKIEPMLEKAKAYRAEIRASMPKDQAQPKVKVYYDLIKVEADGNVQILTSMDVSDIPAGSYYINRGTNGPNIDDQLAFYIKNRGYSNYNSDAENNKHVKFVLGQALVGGGHVVIIDRARKVEALKNRTSNVVDTDFYGLYRATANRLLGGNAADNAAISQVLAMYASDRPSAREFSQTGLFPLVATIDDPEIVDLITMLNSKTTYTRERIKYLRIVSGNIYSQDETAKKTEALMVRINATLDKYPLLGVLSGKAHKRSAMLNDLVEYLNTTYGKANKA